MTFLGPNVGSGLGVVHLDKFLVVFSLFNITSKLPSSFHYIFKTLFFFSSLLFFDPFFDVTLTYFSSISITIILFGCFQFFFSINS